MPRAIIHPPAETSGLAHLAHISSYTVPFVMAIASLFIYQRTTATTNIHGFVLKETRSFPEYNAVGYLYVHQKHHCQFLDIKTTDTHNFFSTAFRTTVLDGTGSTHVLEHLSLHGSDHYPISGVFTELLKRSLATFMNAWTSIEFTAYPFSSTNYQDFHNILDVYLDATFHPRLTPVSFESECHHLEFIDPNDTNSELRHSGVVYNEMIGDMSQPSSFFAQKIRENLFPDSVLRYNHGGNPPDILTLTLDQIKAQHNRYYHPCNSFFYHYGSFDVEEIMEKVDKQISEFSENQVTIDPNLIEQKKWNEPHTVTVDGPTDESNSTRFAVAWMTGDSQNISNLFDMSFISSLLCDGITSPIYKELIARGYGTSLTNIGFESSISNPMFSIGVEGIDSSTGVNLSEKVTEILNNVYSEGFDQERIKSLLHQMELGKKTVTASKGIQFYQGLIGNWIYGVNPFALLDINWELERIRRVLSVRPRYFEEIVKTHLIDNKHRLNLVMNPIPNFLEKESAKLREELEELKSKLTETEKEQIKNTTQRILALVDEPKPVELLPSIKIADINTTAAYVEPNSNSNNIATFIQPVNGIAYVTIKVEINNHSNSNSMKYIQDLDLLSDVITSMGTADLDEDELSIQTDLKTGGITSRIDVLPDKNDVNKCKIYFLISGSALSRNIEKLIELMEKIILTPKLDNTNRLDVIIKGKLAQFSQAVAEAGQYFSDLYSAAHFSKTSALEEMWYGYSFHHHLRKLSKNGLEFISQRLQSIYEDLFLKGTFSAILHCEENDKDLLQSLMKQLLSKLNKNSDSNSNSNSKSYKYHLEDQIEEFQESFKNKSQIHLQVDSSTYFSTISIKGVNFNDKLNPIYSITVNLLKNEFLHDEIREKLGAYGSIASYSPLSGYATFSSYRDTSPDKVLKAILKSIKKVAEGKIDQEMVNRAIIQKISDYDSPISPSDEGSYSLLFEVTKQQTQERRNAWLQATVEQVIQVAQQLLNSEKRFVIVGGSAKIPEGYESVPIEPPVESIDQQ